MMDLYWMSEMPEGKIRVKLIVTSILSSKKNTFMNHFAHNVEGVVGKVLDATPLGAVHTAVQIGHMVLEWTYAGVVVKH